MNHKANTSQFRPQDDYFNYVNHEWLSNNPIPASESSWGTFYVLRDEAWRAVSNIIDTIRATQLDSLEANQIKLKDFFDSALDFADHEAIHKQTLDTELAKITAIDSKQRLASYLGYAHQHDFNMLWGVYVSLDDKNSRMQVLSFHQRGLGMPNRDYYLENSPQMKKFRSAYQTYITELSALHDASGGDSHHILAIENALADASWTDVELRDVEKNYNHYSLASFKSEFSGFDWDAYFSELGWNTPSDNIVIGQPSFLHAALDIIESQPLNVIKTYLSWKLRSGFAAWTSTETFKKSFAFYETALNGVTDEKPLWKRAVMMADSLVVGELLGREYAKEHFPASSKNDVGRLVEDIRSAYHLRINKLNWMHESTKERAHKKLDNMKVFIGYPSVWRDVGSLAFSANDVIKNILKARSYENIHQLSKVGQPPADEEWEMNAHTVNAYHHPNRLEIVFPAAILQPPFYDPSASYATNLGGIGAVIGHEFTHGFDDQGAQFDEHGNVSQWQTDEERKSFSTLAQLIVTQANAFETVPGTFLQGDLVLGEAIADVGGLQLAVEALESTQSTENDFEELFLNFATAECGHATTERLLQLAKIDPHPPSPFRVNAVVNHIDHFYQVYDVKPGDTLYRPQDQRAHIW